MSRDPSILSGCHRAASRPAQALLILALLVPQLAQARDYYVAPLAPLLLPTHMPLPTAEAPRPEATLDWLVGGQVTGDGHTEVDLWFFASQVDGSPALGLDLYFCASLGMLGPLVEHEGGLYSIAYTPPMVTSWSEELVTTSGLSAERSTVWVQHTFFVQPLIEAPPLAADSTRKARPRGRTARTTATALMVSDSRKGGKARQ